MLPVLMAAELSDPTATMFAWMATAVSALATVLTTVTLAKFGSLTKKSETQTEKIHELDKKVVWLEGQRGQHAEAIQGLKNEQAKVLTKESFDLATATSAKTLEYQNRELAEVKNAIREVRDNVVEIDKSKVSRSDMRAARDVRVPERPPARREDGVGERELPSDPPAPRPKQKSIGRYGAE